MVNRAKEIGSLIAFVALSACGGSTTSPVYQAFTGINDSTSILGGNAIKRGNVVALSGSYKHDSGATVLADGTYTLNDADGFDASGVLSDGTSTARTNNEAGFTGIYDFARPFTQSNAGGVDVFGVVGLETATSDIPRSETATYTGEAEAVLATNTQGYDLVEGTSQVTADFGAQTVSVTLSDFSVRDQMTGSTATAPVDEITMTNMAITGNTFQSSNVQTRRNGAVVYVIGSNSTRTASGTFFGISPDGTQPDEVGGAVVMEGDSGQITGLFIANAD